MKRIRYAYLCILLHIYATYAYFFCFFILQEAERGKY